jgi:hypothetical protein
MHLPHYQLTIGESKSIFEFTSQGPKGDIPKIIVFSKISENGLYNLAFGDYDEKTGQVNDRAVSNNGDSEKILATVIQALYIFFNKYPKRKVFAQGSTKSRTRLYRMGISKFHNDVKHLIYIAGRESEVSDWEEFQLNKEYISFAVQLKMQ